MVKIRGWIAAATSGLIVASAIAPAAAADESISWFADTNITSSLEGIALGDVAYTTNAETFAAWTQTSGVNYQPKVSRVAQAGSTSWSLDTATGTRSQTSLALSADGSTGFAVYKKMVSGVRQLWWSRWNGKDWSESQLLSNSVDANTPPAVGIRRDGTFGVLAWKTLGNNTSAAIFDGSTFAAAKTVSNATTSDMVRVSVAASANRAIISWISTSIQLRSSAWNGSTWGPERNVSQNSGASTTSKGLVGLSADGSRSVAVWVMDTGAKTVRTAMGDGDTWGTPQSLGQSVTTVQDVDVALNADGSRAWAAWGYDTGAVGNSIYLQRAEYVSGGWAGSSIVGGPWSDDTTPSPDLAISDSGDRAVITYRGKADSANFIGRAQAYSQGEWGTAVPVGFINSDPASGLTRMALSTNGTQGSAVAVQKTGGSQVLVNKRMLIQTVPDAASAPTGELITNELGDSVKLSWTPPSFTGNLPITGYVVQSDPAGLWCDPGVLPRCSVTGLVPGVAYRFRVLVSNPKGISEPSAWSEPFALPAPPIPPAVDKVTVKQGKKVKKKRKVVIRWTTTAPATDYRVRVTKPRAKKWKAWRTVTQPRVALQLKRKATYRVAVAANSAAGKSAAKVVRFRVKR